MLVQNNNKTNVPSRHSFAASIGASSSNQGIAKQPFRDHSVSNSRGGFVALRTKQNQKSAGHQATSQANHARKQRQHAASKENANQGEFSSTAATCRAFRVIQSGTETSYKKGGNLIASHSSLRPHQTTQLPSRQDIGEPKVRGRVRRLTTWKESCPCGNAKNPLSSMIADSSSSVEHFNCVNCGGLAFRTSTDSAKNIGQTQPVFAIKLEKDCERVEAHPQAIMRQLRVNARGQRAELRTFVPQNELFDSRILQARDTMLELIAEIGECLKQSQLTIHLAVEYLDRFLLLRAHFSMAQSSAGDQEYFNRLFENHSVDAVAITLILLASKFDEIDDNIPLIDEFCRAHTLVSDSLERGFLNTAESSKRERLTLNRTYPGFHALQRCELHLLGILCWDLNTVTPLHFVQNHLYQGVVFSDDKSLDLKQALTDKNLLEKVKKHVAYFSNLALKQEFIFAKTFEDETIAAAIIFAARQASKIFENPWNEDAFKSLFGANLDTAGIQECFKQLYDTYEGVEKARSVPKSIKIEINFDQVDSSEGGTEPKLIETERAATLEVDSKPSEIGDDHQTANEVVSTRGCEEHSSGMEILSGAIDKADYSSNPADSSSILNDQSKDTLHCSAKTTQKKGTQPNSKSKKKNTSSKQLGFNRSTSKPSMKSKSKSMSSSSLLAKITQNNGKKVAKITAFEQQQSLKPCIITASQAPTAEEPKEVEKSLSPVKEFREREGPIKVFDKPRSGNDRSQSSSKSIIRLQPTVFKRLVTESNQSSASHLYLHAVMAPSTDESLQKRNNMRSQKSTTPRSVLDFSQQNRSRLGSKGRKSAATECSQERSSTNQAVKNSRISLGKNGPLQKFVDKQRNQIQAHTNKQKQSEARHDNSKSVLLPWNPEERLATQVVIGVDLTTQSDYESNDPKMEPLRSTSSMLETQLTSELAPFSTKSRGDQNFIQRNINYVTQLEQKAKERKSVNSTRPMLENPESGIKARISLKLETGGENHRAIEVSKFAQNAPAKPTTKPSSRQLKKPCLNTSSSKQQFLTSSSSANSQQKLGKKTSGGQGTVIKTTTETGDSTVTSTVGSPKQTCTYQSSKLFQKKHSFVLDTNTSSTEVVNHRNIEHPRVSNPTKQALHKFKAPQLDSAGMPQQQPQQKRATSRISYSHSTMEESKSAVATEYGDDTTFFKKQRSSSNVPSEKATSCEITAATSQSGAAKRNTNNHLRPTKSSMLRAKSSMGFVTTSESDSSGKSGGISGKMSQQNEVQVTVAEEQTLSKFSSMWQSKSRSSMSGPASPQFGARRQSKVGNSYQRDLHLQDRHSTGPSATSLVNKSSSNLVPTPDRSTSSLEKIQIELKGGISRTGNNTGMSSFRAGNAFDEPRKSTNILLKQTSTSYLCNRLVARLPSVPHVTQLQSRISTSRHQFDRADHQSQSRGSKTAMAKTINNSFKQQGIRVQLPSQERLRGAKTTIH